MEKSNELWKNQWASAHEQLKNAMKKEIAMMREILANMHEEELSLLLNDTATWNGVMQQRSSMVEQLGSARSERLLATKKIEDLSSLQKDGKEPALEQLLPPEEEDSCEILSLRDQLMALAEKMNFQNCRNTGLFQEGGRSAHRPFSSSSPAPTLGRPKRKSSIATYGSKR